mgnify:CR=1 FL=1
MKVLAIQLSKESKPLLNNNYIDVENSNYADYALKLEKDFLIVEHKSKGTYAIPLTAISWMRVEKAARGRPKKVA